MPPQAYWSFSPGAMAAYLPVSKFAMAENPPRKAKDDPRKAGISSFVHRWKNRVPKPAKNKVVWVLRGRP